VPPTIIRIGGKLRRTLLVVVLLVAAGGVFGFLWAGRFMAVEDPLEHADAIFVLAGTRVERPLEAADLYLSGWAPRVLVTRDSGEVAADSAERRGVHVPSDFDLSREVLLRLGVPEDALITPDRLHDNTASEAETLREIALQRKWRRVIVVSSKYHLRRAALICRRKLRGTDVQLIVRGSRYDPATPETWWRRRSDIRWLLLEVPKLVGYSLGVGT
jgi:uncharacterized SAM-binding protein YcdF (DUF218 family)